MDIEFQNKLTRKIYYEYLAEFQLTNSDVKLSIPKTKTRI